MKVGIKFLIISGRKKIMFKEKQVSRKTEIKNELFDIFYKLLFYKFSDEELLKVKSIARRLYEELGRIEAFKQQDRELQSKERQKNKIMGVRY